MKKITELTETRKRTVYYKDAYGNRERGVEEFVAKRPVKSISQGPRIGHFLADYIVFLVILYILEFTVDSFKIATNSDATVLFGDFSLGIINLLLYPCYYFAFEKIWGKTPGKFLTKAIVINEYAEKPSTKALVLRSIIRLVPFEPFSCFDDKHSHGWHDKWSDTWVVNEEELNTLKELLAEESKTEG